MIRSSGCLFWTLVALAWSAANCHASDIVGYNPSLPSPLNPTGPLIYDPRFDRFTTNFGKFGSPNTEPPLANVPPAPSATQFVLSGFDLSGVGWLSSNPIFSFAMISPRHFITAAHNGETTFLPNTPVTFFTGNASNPTTVTAMVAGSARVANLSGGVTDILLGTLTADVPSGVTSYPISIGFRSEYIGLPVTTYDQFHRVGTNNVSLFDNNRSIDNPSGIPNSTNLIGYEFTASGPDGDSRFVIGDSGKPTFLTINGQLTLLGSHSAVTTDGLFSLDTFLPDYIAQMNVLMLPTGYAVRVVPVPEPTFALVVTAIGAGTWTGWRRFRGTGRRAGAA